MTKHSTNSQSISGMFWVGLAALLWSTDSIVRYPILKQINPLLIVFIEHILAILILFPWILKTEGKRMFSLTLAQWLAALFCGVGGSALATFLFTASFRYLNPSVSILIQKFQPILVILLAYLILKERPVKKFYLCGLIALLAEIGLSFPDLNFTFLRHPLNLHSLGIQYSFFAAFLWAAATISGKILVNQLNPLLATFWRFFFGFLTLLISAFFQIQSMSFSFLHSGPTLIRLLYLSLVPGLFAMLIYYKGLTRIKAGTATLIELIYPIGGILLNTMILHTPLNTIQLISGGILLMAITWLAL